MFTLIVVDYNALDKTIAYVRDAYANLGTTGAGHTVIVENGAQEGTLEKMSQQFGAYQTMSLPEILQTVYLFQKDGQKILYCNSGENLGYARGNNLGIMIAKSVWNDPYYLISNNDLVFTKKVDMGLITGLFQENPEIGAIGPMVRTPAGESQSPRKWQGPFRRLILLYWILALGSVLPASVHRQLWEHFCADTVENAPSGRCDWLMGCFFFARAEALWAAGLFDEHTFLYAEEMILSRRLESKGYFAYFCRDVEIIHQHGQTTKTAMSELKTRELDFQANLYFYQTYVHAPVWLLTLAKWNFFGYKFLFTIFRKLRKK